MDRSDNLIASLVCFGAATTRLSAVSDAVQAQQWVLTGINLISLAIALWIACKLLREVVS